MEKKGRTLDNETQLLISIGAAVAAGCVPCLQTIAKMARDAGIEGWKLKSAAMTGQFIKDKPMDMMKACSDELLGTHLLKGAGTDTMACPGLPGIRTGADKEACGCTQPSPDNAQCGQEGCCPG